MLRSIASQLRIIAQPFSLGAPLCHHAIHLRRRRILHARHHHIGRPRGHSNSNRGALSVTRAVSTVSGDDRGTGGFKWRYFDPHPLSSLTPPSALLVRAQEFQSAPAAKPAGVVYRAVQLGRGAAQGEWRVEFGAGNLTTVTHLAATPVSLPLSFVDAALFYPTPGEDHAILDVEAGADGSPPLGTFLLVPEDHEETWQRLGVRALRKRESEVSGGLGDGSGTNCCTCWCVGHRQGP
jgi:hypothetical protein